MTTPHLTGWASEASKSSASILLSSGHSQRIAPRHDHANLLAKQASPDALLASPTEMVPPTCIPDDWHVKVALPQRPEHLGDLGSRFAWKAAPHGDGSGLLTVFPMVQPYGALDMELLEQWVEETLAVAREAPGGVTGQGPGTAWQRELEVYEMAVHEVGRASGSARCTLLRQLWLRASSAWRAQASSGQRVESVENLRLRRYM